MQTPTATILIVDDLPANRMVIERHLQRLGHLTLPAENGLQALEVLRAQPIDMVLLDIMMPVMNGFEALVAIKADPRLAHIPVVVISAMNDVESVARCITLGAEDFLFKPVERVLLEARVAAGLARKRLHDYEQAAYTAAEEANQAKGRFVSLVSHELKSPLTALIGYADLALLHQGQELEPALADYLRTIQSLGRQMSHILEDLSDLTRIESGQLSLRPEPFVLGMAVEAAVAAVRGLAAARRHQLQIALDHDLPLVWGDRMRLIQVLTNLLSNACKYTPEGGQIWLTAIARSPSQVEVAVRDNGFGIAPAEQARIFEAFFRSTDASIRQQPGTGLGLNITRNLVELQGGTIWFTSSPGEGTTFAFTLLTAPATASGQTDHPEPALPSNL